MSEQLRTERAETSRRLLRGGARAITGVAAIGVSVAVAVALGTGLVPIPAIERGVVAVEADTSQNSTLSLVCTGAFAELGADPKLPTTAIPGGDTQLVVSGEAAEQRELQRELNEGSAPRVLEVSSRDALAAAEVQQVVTPTLQGLAASSCVEPAHEQWLVGGATGLGQSSTLVLGNPFEVPATVQVTLFDAEGPVESSRSTGVLVPAGSQRIVSLNGYAPGRAGLAVRVESTGAAVAAALGVSQTVDIRSYAVDSVTRQVAPQTRLVVPAVANVSGEGQAAAGSEGDDFPVVVRVLAPEAGGGSPAGATATVRALLPDGSEKPLGEIELEGDELGELEVAEWPAKAQAVVIEADAPVVGGVFGSADVPPGHDYAWFAPAPMLPADTDVAVSIVNDGELVIANTGEADATVTITPDDGIGKESIVEVPAGAAVAVAASEQNTLRSTEPVSAAVRVVKGAHIAGYPVQAPAPRGATLTVYPR